MLSNKHKLVCLSACLIMSILKCPIVSSAHFCLEKRKKKTENRKQKKNPLKSHVDRQIPFARDVQKYSQGRERE
jgi:hypothetical protein